MRGHFFCDSCDDLAFGRRCQHCGRDSRWVAAEGVRNTKPTVSPERGRQLFAQIHRFVDAMSHENDN